MGSTPTLATMKDVRFELKLFSWHKDTRTLAAHISDLDIPGNLPSYLTIDNPDTKQSRVFRYLKTDKDEEGDIQAWHYENISHGLKLTIWND